MPQEVRASVKNTRGYFRSSSQPHRHGRSSSLTAHRHASGPTSVPASATALPSCTPRPLKGPSPCPAASSPNDFSFAEAEHKENQKRFGSEPLRTWLPAVPQRLGFCEPAGGVLPAGCPPMGAPPHAPGRHLPFSAPQRAHLYPQGELVGQASSSGSPGLRGVSVSGSCAPACQREAVPGRVQKLH